MNTTDQLNNKQRRHLDEQGYLILPAVLSSHEVLTFRDRLDELWQQEGDRAGTEFDQEPG